MEFEEGDEANDDVNEQENIEDYKQRMGYAYVTEEDESNEYGKQKVTNKVIK